MAGIHRGAVALFLGAFTLAGCTSTVPNDVAAGVGFQDYQQWQERRAMLRGEGVPIVPQTVRPPLPPVTAALPPVPQPTLAPAPVMAATPAPVAVPAPAIVPQADVARIAAAAIAAAETRPAPPQTAPVADPLPARLAAPANRGISDEQDFDAVAERESIESDAERLARMQAERVVIAPTAIPDRPADIGPNIIDYALATTHPVGERRHTRRPIAESRHQRACLAFRSADLAQEWFLQNGGPNRDRQGLDPDGDGYACDWNPGVYRSAAAAARN
jgi:hypothetical protein